MAQKDLNNTIKNLPKSCGIYLFKNKSKDVLYVGKANNLRSRVKSYFAKDQELSLSKLDMISRVAGVETIPTDTEEEALVLEALNIKKYKPPYNVALKDDKDYSFVKIDLDQEFPTVTVVRRPKIDIKKSKQKFFGPFTSGYALQENLRFLRRIFPYRKRIKALGKFEKDLLKRRSIGAVPESAQEYQDMIKRLMKVIDGHTASVQRGLKKKMLTLSNQKQYEAAAKVRNQMHWLDIFKTRQKIVSAKEYLERAMPKRDDSGAALAELQAELKLKNTPSRIEGYDISNISGQFAVGSMVVFTNGAPDKNEYRKFKIKTVNNSDDFAMLAEVLKRRFKHGNWRAPDLVLLDGGKGQLSVIIRTLFNNKKHTSSILRLDASKFIALAKRKEEVFQGEKLSKIKLDIGSRASRLLQRIRDEAHRFAIKYYHSLHSKSVRQK